MPYDPYGADEHRDSRYMDDDEYRRMREAEDDEYEYHGDAADDEAGKERSERHSMILSGKSWIKC